MDKRIVASIFLLVFDFMWIGLFMGRQYKTQVKNIQGKPMKTKCLFVMPNIRDSHALIDSLTYGLTFGLVLYGVYDFTIAAVLSKWNIPLAIADVAWGSFVFFISAYLGALLGN